GKAIGLRCILGGDADFQTLAVHSNILLFLGMYMLSPTGHPHAADIRKLSRYLRPGRCNDWFDRPAVGHRRGESCRAPLADRAGSLSASTQLSQQNNSILPAPVDSVHE